MCISNYSFTEAMFMDKVGYYYDTYLWKWPNRDFNGVDHEEKVNVDKFFGRRRLNRNSPYKNIFGLLPDYHRMVLLLFSYLSEKYIDNDEGFWIEFAKELLGKQIVDQEMVYNAKSELSNAICMLNTVHPTEEFAKYVNDQERSSANISADLSGPKRARPYPGFKLKVVFQDNWIDKEVAYRFGY